MKTMRPPGLMVPVGCTIDADQDGSREPLPKSSRMAGYEVIHPGAHPARNEIRDATLPIVSGNGNIAALNIVFVWRGL